MTNLRVVEPFPPYEDREPGMMWRYEDRDEPDRECWWIILPPSPEQGAPGHPGELSWRTTDRAAKPPHDRWQVSGEPPCITVTPSIDVERWEARPDGTHFRAGSYWHGFITDGVLTSPDALAAQPEAGERP